MLSQGLALSPPQDFFPTTLGMHPLTQYHTGGRAWATILPDVWGRGEADSRP